MGVQAVETSSQRFWLSSDSSVSAQTREALASFSELETNADNICEIATELVTCSAYDPDKNSQGWTELVVTVSSDTVQIGVSDAGKGFDPSLLPLATNERQMTAAFELIDDLVDRWGVEESAGKAYVWFEVDR